MKNMVITNFYGYENIGDRAIFDIALKTINNAFPDNVIHVHTATKFSTKIKDYRVKTYLHPYGIAIKASNRLSDSQKVLRFIEVFTMSLFLSLLGKANAELLPKKGDYAYIAPLRHADIVFGMGGGYLRTKSVYKDYFGLLLTLLPIFIAHLYNKRILYLPMSFGNFSSPIHEKMVFSLLKNDLVIFRDEKSSQQFNKHTDKKLDTYVIPDLALFDTHKKNTKNNRNYIVLTARLWMDTLKQGKYEKGLAAFVHYIWQKYHLKTIFIPMVWNKNEDNDVKVGVRVKKLVKDRSIFKIAHVRTPLQVKKILSQAKFAVCTRMHSAILATVVKTPFITIAYEDKTTGFLKHLGLEKWNIDIYDFSFDLLREKCDDLLKNQYVEFELKLVKKHNKIKDDQRLTKIVKSFGSAAN